MRQSANPLAGQQPVQHADDHRLAMLAAGGENSAFRTIMQNHNQRLYRVARGILGGETEVEDVLQDAYVLAFRHIRDFRGDAKLSTWLTRIVVNEALGRLRRRKDMIEFERMDTMAETGQIIPFPAGDADPEHLAARAEVRRLLEDAIDALPAHFRTVFVMRDVEEISIEETAAHLDLRPETVKTRLHRARRLLRTALKRRLSAGLADAYPFGGARCARVTDAVMARLFSSPL